jgi:poly(beta-D-mannuronate) lyase
MFLDKKRTYAALATLLATQAYAQTVPLNNPSFENNFNGWNDTDPSSISSVAFDGSRSVKITGSNGRVEQDVAVEANTNYRLSAYIRGNGTIGVNVGSVHVSENSSSSNWTETTVEFNSGSATTAEIFGKYRSGDSRFDLFSLEKLSSSSDPTPPSDNDQPISCSANSNLVINSASDDGTNDGNGPSNTLDNNFSTRWSSFGINKAIQFDLGTNALVKDISIAFFKGDQRRAFFEVDTSLDGNNWTSVLTSAQSSGNSTQLESFDLIDTTARYVRVVGQGNSSNNWNSILETRIMGCTDSSTTPDDPPPTSGDEGLDPNLPPSGNFELIDWNISIPVDNNNDGKADTIKEIPLSSGYENSEYFYTAADGGVVFKSKVSGAKTSSNTKFTRSELREMLRRGDTSFSTKGVGGNNWVFGDAPSSDRNVSGGVDGTLDATLAVNHVTTTGSNSQVGRVIVGQIHANDDEPIRLYYRKLPGNSKGSIYFAHEPNGGSDQYIEMIGSRSSSASNPSDGIALDEKFSYRIRVDGSNLTVTIMRPGKPDISRSVDMSNSGYNNGGQYMYFKAGVYNQNNSGNNSDYVQATFYKIENSHTGYAF